MVMYIGDGILCQARMQICSCLNDNLRASRDTSGGELSA